MSDPVIQDLNRHLAQQDADEAEREARQCPTCEDGISMNTRLCDEGDGKFWMRKPCAACIDAHPDHFWRMGDWRDRAWMEKHTDYFGTPTQAPK